MIRFTLGASACGFLMLLPAVASAQLGDGDYVAATDGVWTIEFVREEAIEEDDFYLPAYAGLDSWYSFDSDSELPLFRDHMFREWFYFRTDDGDYSGQEHPIDALTINDISNVNPLSGELQANLIHVSFGQHGVDPIGVSVVFELEETEAGGRGSTIRETIQVQNFLDRSQSVELFAYTDLDMDNSVFNGSATLVDSRTIRQQSFIGSTVDVHVAAGPTPSAFDIAPYADIENLLDDDSPTDLNNNSALGPGDATHAFQWRLNLEAFGLDVGDIETIQLEKIGSFVDLVLPEVGPDGEFIFDEQDPSTTGLPPTWYDPEVLTGYEYEVQAGENAFAELYLPEGFEDGVYTLEILDPSHSRFGELITIEGNGATLRSFDFTADGNSGATAFRIGGIEPEAFIDPDDPLGFPTGLTFVSGTPLRFVQSAVLTNIPEPAGLLLVASAAVVGWPRRIYR